MRKALTMLFAVCMACSSWTSLAAKAEAPLFGDMNSDSTVDASDASEILVVSAMSGANGSVDLTSEQLKYADINSDGSINSVDAAYILMYAADVGAGLEESQLKSYVYETTKTIQRLALYAPLDSGFPADGTVKIFEDHASLETHLGQWDHYMGINTHNGLGTGYDKEEFLSLVCEPYTEEFFEQYNVAAIHLREYASPTWHEVYAIDGNADGSVSVSMIRHNKWGEPLEEQWIILVQVDKTVTDTQMVNVVIMEQ